MPPGLGCLARTGLGWSIIALRIDAAQVRSYMYTMPPKGFTLAELTTSDVMAAIADAQLESMREHAVAAQIRVTLRMDGSAMVLDLTAQTAASTVTRSMIADSVWFARRSQAETYLVALIRAVVRSSVAEMDLASEGLER